MADSVYKQALDAVVLAIQDINLEGINWVIVGGESGPGARPMKPEWVTEIRDKCIEAGVPFFFKQWGGARKKKAGKRGEPKPDAYKRLEGEIWHQMPKGEGSQAGRAAW